MTSTTSNSFAGLVDDEEEQEELESAVHGSALLNQPIPLQERASRGFLFEPLADLSWLFESHVPPSDDPDSPLILNYLNWAPLHTARVGWCPVILDPLASPHLVLGVYQIIQAFPIIIVELLTDGNAPRRGTLPMSFTVLCLNVLGVMMFPDITGSHAVIPCSPSAPSASAPFYPTEIDTAQGLYHSSLTEKNRAAARGLVTVCLGNKQLVDKIVGPQGDPKSPFAISQAAHNLPVDLVNLCACQRDNIVHFLTWNFARTPATTWPSSGKVDSFHLCYLNPIRMYSFHPGIGGSIKIRELLLALIRVLSSIYLDSGDLFTQAFAPLVELLGDGKMISLRNFDSLFVLELVSHKLCSLALGLQTAESSTISTKPALLRAMQGWLHIDIKAAFDDHLMYAQLQTRGTSGLQQKRPASGEHTRPPPPKFQATRPVRAPFGARPEDQGTLCTKHLNHLLFPDRPACSASPCPHTHLSALSSPMHIVQRNRLLAAVSYLRETQFKLDLVAAIRALA